MNAEVISALCLLLAATPCALFLLNLLAYRRLGPSRDSKTAVSLLIPARNEAENIRATLEAALRSQRCDFEIIVLDDHSTDETWKIVEEIANRNPRVRLETASALPKGWCGKQYACYTLAKLARHPLLVFIDADVRLAPDALSRMALFMESHKVALASGVPRQEVGTLAERLLIPLIHFVLLGFLPIHAMRRNRWAAMSAGCGQLFVVRRQAYEQTGGHARLADSLHDGIKLPRIFREAGMATDLFDATDLASCRMYRTNTQTWLGLGKNATEALAARERIIPMTLLLFGGQVWPFVWVMRECTWMSLAAVCCVWVPRLIAAFKFQQPIVSALLHPVGIVGLLAIQWQAFVRQLMGKPSAWKGRTYPVGTVKAL